MALALLKKVFGSRNERVLRQLSRIVVRINALEPEFEKLSDDVWLPKFRPRAHS